MLLPEHVDDHSGYRYYGTHQLERSELIARLRRTTMSLEEIRNFLECPHSDRMRILDNHRTRLRERAAATTDAMRVLDQLAGQVGEVDVPPTVHATPMVGMTLWDQPVLCIRAGASSKRCTRPPSDRASPRSHRPTSPAVSRTRRGVWRTEVGWPVERLGEVDGRVEPATLPGGDVASTLYTGRFEDIAFAYRHLWTEIAAAGFTPIGNPREIYATKPDGRAPQDYCTEVVWPIKREQ